MKKVVKTKETVLRICLRVKLMVCLVYAREREKSAQWNLKYHDVGAHK